MKPTDNAVMRNRRHLIIAIVCVAVVLSMLVSSSYLAYEAVCRHSCVGENCPICQFIAQIEGLHRGFGLALLALLLCGFALAAVRAWHRQTAAGTVPAFATLVGRKIRLNN